MVQAGSHFFDQNPRDRISVLLTPWTIRLNFASRCRIYALSRLNRQKRTGRKEDRCCFFHSWGDWWIIIAIMDGPRRGRGAGVGVPRPIGMDRNFPSSDADNIYICCQIHVSRIGPWLISLWYMILWATIEILSPPTFVHLWRSHLSIEQPSLALVHCRRRCSIANRWANRVCGRATIRVTLRQPIQRPCVANSSQ